MFVRALRCRHFLHTDAFVICLLFTEANLQQLHCQIRDSLPIRVNATAVQIVHPHERKRYAPLLRAGGRRNSVFDTQRHRLANDAHVDIRTRAVRHRYLLSYLSPLSKYRGVDAQSNSAATAVLCVPDLPFRKFARTSMRVITQYTPIAYLSQMAIITETLITATTATTTNTTPPIKPPRPPADERVIN